MDAWEELVLQYFTFQRPLLFINPNYLIPDDPKLPDFVVLNFKQKIVSIVEVNAGVSLGKLKAKARYLEMKYTPKLKALLQDNSVVDDSWKYVLEFFLDPRMLEKFEQNLGLDVKPCVHSLEEVLPWKLKWPRPDRPT